MRRSSERSMLGDTPCPGAACWVTRWKQPRSDARPGPRHYCLEAREDKPRVDGDRATALVVRNADGGDAGARAARTVARRERDPVDAPVSEPAPLGPQVDVVRRRPGD